MQIVLEVSMVDLWAAEAYLVTATPVALKPAIETIINNEVINNAGYSLI